MARKRTSVSVYVDVDLTDIDAEDLLASLDTQDLVEELSKRQAKEKNLIPSIPIALDAEEAQISIDCWRSNYREDARIHLARALRDIVESL